MDNHKRQLFLLTECKKKLLKSLTKSKNTPYYSRYKALYLLSKLPKTHSIVQVRNRCYIYGRVWAVNKRTRLTRFALRNQAYNSTLPGFRRASW